MAIKSWFGSRGGGSQEGLSTDDLIALRRFDEAIARLRAELNADPNDLHHRLKLADLLMECNQRGEALTEYFAVADGHAREGFFNKAEALLAKVDRLLPDNEKVQRKIDSLHRVRNVERRRDLVVEGLLENRHLDGESGRRAAFQVQKFWRALAANPLVERMPDDQLQRLFRAFQMRQHDEGDTLAQTGSNQAELYLIAAGEIAAQAVLSSGKRTSIRTFSPGDLVGDRALLEHRPWPAEYVATKASVILALSRPSLEKALQGESDPRGFLEALRAQRHDHEVAATVAKFRKGEAGE